MTLSSTRIIGGQCLGATRFGTLPCTHTRRLGRPLSSATLLPQTEVEVGLDVLTQFSPRIIADWTATDPASAGPRIIGV